MKKNRYKRKPPIEKTTHQQARRIRSSGIRRKRREHVLAFGSTKMKEKEFAHFSTAGYAILSMAVMGLFLLLGTNIGGLLGSLVAILGIGWSFWKFPNVMQSWENIEKYNPEIRKYRIDK